VTGHYMLIDLEPGTHILVASSVGYTTVKKEVTIHKDEVIEVNFELEEEAMSINEVVITGTKTFKRQTDAAVIVNVITRFPRESSYDVSYTSSLINGETWDYVLSGNINMLTHKNNAGAAVYVNRRMRQAYDHNGDNFSELP